MERIETPFIRFFFLSIYILSLFLHNDDLSPLDFLFLIRCAYVCVCVSARVCVLLCPLRDFRSLQAAGLNETKLLHYS